MSDFFYGPLDRGVILRTDFVFQAFKSVGLDERELVDDNQFFHARAGAVTAARWARSAGNDSER